MVDDQKILGERGRALEEELIVAVSLISLRSHTYYWNPKEKEACQKLRAALDLSEANSG